MVAASKRQPLLYSARGSHGSFGQKKPLGGHLTSDYLHAMSDAVGCTSVGVKQKGLSHDTLDMSSTFMAELDIDPFPILAKMVLV